MKQPNSITPKPTIMINMDNNEKQIYDHICTNYGSLEKFFEAIAEDKAKNEMVIGKFAENLDSLLKTCEDYQRLAHAYQNMSPPKFTWCWLKSKLTKNPVSV